MPEEPQIKMLPMEHRARFFWVLVLVFILTLPVVIFYTTGYRLSFTDEDRVFVTTGGMYINTDADEVDVYLDEEIVDRPRFIRQEYYVQNIASGKHRVVVQRPDLQTWVKELMVSSRYVTVVSAFNMPATPHIRPVAEYETAAGTQVFLTYASSSSLFPNATTTVPITTSEPIRSDISFTVNEEYEYVVSLFSTSTEPRESLLAEPPAPKRFGFVSELPPIATTATSTLAIEQANTELLVREGELYARWVGSPNQMPNYYCVASTSASSTAARYGEHVAEAVAEYAKSTTTPLVMMAGQWCRPEIRIDRQGQQIYSFYFYPDNADLVLLLLDDGLYLTEIDDRSWQNNQLLYPGNNLEVVVENGSIYVREGDYYFEVITEIEPAV